MRRQSEMQGAMRMLANLPSNSVIQYPSGRWGFVGRVDARLAYMQADGSPATDEQLETARQCGPGFAKLKTRSWETREAAELAAQEVANG